MGYIFEGLDAEAYDRSYTDRQLLARTLRYFRPFLTIMLIVVGLIVLNALMDTAVQALIAWGIDQVVTTRTTRMIMIVVGAILVASVLSWIFNRLRQSCTARATGSVVLNVRCDAFAAIIDHDMSFYDEYPSGKIVSRVVADTESFANVVALTLNLLSQIALWMLVVGVLLTRDVWLTLVALIITPLIFGVALSFRQIARRTAQRAQRALANVNANVQETMSGIAVAKTFRQEQTLYNDFKRLNEQRYQADVRQGFVLSGIFPILITVTGLGTTMIIYFGGQKVLDGTVSAGTWFLFVQSISMFWFPLTSIASFWSLFQQGLAAGERVFALIDAQPCVVQHDQQPVPQLAGQIVFQDVEFRYGAQEMVLSRFNLTIRAGETVALVGHTGAGKSTLAKLVARFYEYQHGQILIDGRDIRSFDLSSYRRHLGIVPQAPFLFSGSIADNIRYVRPSASDAEVATAARRIGGDWLDGLPQGLQTPVGEQSRGLSLGQCQLVALARVLLQDPAILILDEATASIDPLTEAQIQEGLDVVLRDRTAIIIAHRLSTIQYADRIIVLDHGDIVEQGTHDALMAQGAHYAQLYNTYFRHQSPDYQPGGGYVPVQLVHVG